MKSGSTTLLRAPLIVRRSGTFYIGLFLVTLILFVFAPPSARARSQVKFPPPLKQDENCLACHGQAGMTAGNGKSISVDPGKHAASVHGTLGCKDCHQTIKDYPHPAKVAKVLCASCHDDEASHFPNSCHSARARQPANPVMETTTRLRRRRNWHRQSVRNVTRMR